MVIIKHLSFWVVSLLMLARFASAAGVTIAWDQNPETDLAGYRVYYGILSGPPYVGTEALEGPSPVDFPLSSLGDVTAPQISLSGLPSCAHFYFAVTAHNLAGLESNYSEEVEGTFLDAPRTAVVTPGLRSGVVSVSWDGPRLDDAGAVQGYRVHYDFDPGEPYEGQGAAEGASPVEVPAGQTALQLTDLPPESQIYVLVEGYCADDTLRRSDELSATVASPVCGNAVIEEGELCDPLSTCPVECDDGNSCTTDSLSGAPDLCTSSCSATPVTACTADDGCCPDGCDNNTDSDCSVSCGNGVVEPGETCDPPGSCPAACDDGNSCTRDNLLGSPDSCSASCSFDMITACDPGDGCCPSGCDNNSDSDCSVSCGNGVVEQGETCDPPSSCPVACSDGNACTSDTLLGSAANCSAACTHSIVTVCTSGDGCCPPGCDASSDADCSASCGDSQVDPGETCDPPASCPTSCDDLIACTRDEMTGGEANCNVSCTHTTVTACSDGDGCCPPGCDTSTDEDCSPTCGDGELDPGETCDPPGSCPADCNDGNSCTIDTLTGSRTSCSAACGYTPISTCEPGDGCCPPGCSAATDGDCEPGEPGEQHPGGDPGRRSGQNVLVGGCAVGAAGVAPKESLALLLLLCLGIARARRRHPR